MMMLARLFGTFLVIGGIIGGLIEILSLILLICSYPYNVDKKIEMYSEENQNIEQKVKSTVLAYLDYEKDVYKNMVQSAELQTLIIKYPELNSNELVKSEIETYKENNNKIKKLKESEIDKDIIGWWLFFNIGK